MNGVTRRRSVVLVGRVALVLLLLGGLVLAASDLTTGMQYVPYAAMGGFLAIRRARNAIGWLLIGLGFAFLATTTPRGLDIAGLRAGTASFGDMAFVWAGMWAGGATFLLYAALATTFPSGRWPTGRWRRASIVAMAIGLAFAALPAFVQTLRVSINGVMDITVPNPVGLLPDPSPEALPFLQLVGTALPIAIFAGAVLALVLRYRRADGIVKLQIRWLLASVAFVVLSVVFGLVGFVLSGETVGYVWIPALIAYPTVPIAVGVAVTRYRLFEIDRIISRTISYLGVSALLFAVFAGVTLGIQGVLGSSVGDNALTVATSTLAVAALFNPLRTRMQRIVDRRFNRSRYDQERAVEAFAAKLRNEVDVERLLDQVSMVVTNAVEPSTLTIWRREFEARR